MATLPRGSRSGQTQDLSVHRTLISRVYRILSGRTAVVDSDEEVIVYRIPSPEARQVLQEEAFDYGRIELGNGTAPVAIDQDGVERQLREVGSNSEEKVGFLSELQRLVADRRAPLAMEANEALEREDSKYSKPGGAAGNLVAEYDRLLTAVNNEKHRQLDRS